MFFRTITLGVIVSLASAAPIAAAPLCSAVKDRLGCGCAVPIVASHPIGTLTGVGGDVKKTGAGGYVPVNSDVLLNIGDGVLFGKDGHGLFSAGKACQSIRFGASSSLIVRAVDGCACITAANNVPPPTPPPVPAGGAGLGTAVVPAVAVGGAAGGLLLLNNDEQQNSP